MMTAEEKRAKKARELRYKKPIVRDLNLEIMTNNIYEMQSECYDVQYALDGDEGDEIIAAMLGDEDEAKEFRMMFSDLSAELEAFVTDLQDWEWSEYVDQYYDLFMVNGDVAQSFGGLLGYDSYEGDYFGLPGFYGEDDAKRAAFEKLKKDLTKDKMLMFFQICMKIFTQYVGLQYRYDCLKASMDILRERNMGHLTAVKEINRLYDQADKETSHFHFVHTFRKSEAYEKLDKMIAAMPQEAFL
jgi:hypothetical protein